MENFYSEEHIRKTLALFDEGEAKMQAQLDHYQVHGPARVYKFLLRHHAKSLAQMEVRRKWLKSLLPQD